MLAREVSFEYAVRACLIGCKILVGGASPIDQLDRGEDLRVFKRWKGQAARCCYNMLRWGRWQYAHDYREQSHFYILFENVRV